ncbi:hypothetical protein GIB67_019115 [Kingdonia uniflora]|uniref:Uncharacterized protein n=1 Tax=Kingdonia uniflora TaxID=39325 RepID=A0A7J7MZP3_9MAGN|nr:hypothetical protein GIB67_019115 [Kingdonia uniflora]
MCSITEVVQTVKYPRVHIQANSHDSPPKPEDRKKFNLDFFLPKFTADFESLSTPGRHTPLLNATSDSSRKNYTHDANKKSRKSGRTSLMGLDPYSIFHLLQVLLLFFYGKERKVKKKNPLCWYIYFHSHHYAVKRIVRFAEIIGFIFYRLNGRS